LAFHPYPQLIRAVFNPHRFGPPLDITPASAWPWVDRYGFGSTPTNSVALFRLAFATAPALNALASLVRSNSPDHNAKGTQSPRTEPKSRTKLPPLVGTRFQVLFHSPPGVLFTFPSRYSCTIGRGRVFSLGGWSPLIQSGLLEPRLTRVPVSHVCACFVYRALTCYGGPFQAASTHTAHRAGLAPHRPRNPGGTCPPVWALPLSLAATPGISLDFSSSGYLDVSVPQVGSLAGDGTLLPPGFPIRTSRDQSLLAAPPGFSQLATSFIACPRQGILRAPLLRLASSISSGPTRRSTRTPSTSYTYWTHPLGDRSDKIT